MTEATCNQCGWVHFVYTLEQATEEVERFNAYFDKLTSSEQWEYYGGHRSALASYTQCFSCGGSFRNFRDSKENDCPAGATIQPILERTAEI